MKHIQHLNIGYKITPIRSTHAGVRQQWQML